jgi:uncharacterized Zn-finger protein
LLIHSGIKPHVCPVSSCGKKFSEKGNMKSHYKTHLKNFKQEFQITRTEINILSSSEFSKDVNTGKKVLKLEIKTLIYDNESDFVIEDVDFILNI